MRESRMPVGVINERFTQVTDRCAAATMAMDADLDAITVSITCPHGCWSAQTKDHVVTRFGSALRSAVTSMLHAHPLEDERA